MTFYLIGTGLGPESLSWEALKIIRKCKQVYLENYTVDFPFEKKRLERTSNTKIKELKREEVESEAFLEKAKTTNIALLVYGDSLSATTHSELILNCKKNKIPFQVIHNASILTAIAETGLQLYKFGKTASMPTWKDNWKPDSFTDIIKQNLSMQAHTLLLIDIALDLEKAKQQLKDALEKNKIDVEKIVLCANMGVKSKMIYDKIENLPNKTPKPYCLIIPSKLHFHEEEFLNNL